MKNKIIKIKDLKNIIYDLKNEGKIIVSTSGCFDILHAGHVTYLEEARAKGDILVLLLNSDKSVRALKGSERPIIPEDERAIVVAGLECVDFVCIFNESNPCAALDIIRPDVFIKGGDYRGISIPEIEIMEKFGGRVDFVDMVDGCSSTNIIEKIKEMK